MPLRNLIVILVAAVFSFACYQKAQHNRYAASVADAMRLVENYYVEEVDARTLYTNAMKGMMSGLDQYSSFVDADAFRRMEEDLDQEFGGVGIEVAKLADDQPLVVLSPLVGTPAHRAGLRAGDEIMAIDGAATIGMPRDESVKKMRGRPGSEVTLSVRRFGQDQPEDVKVVREVIMVNSVKGDRRNADGSWDYHLKEDPRIAYLRIHTFGQHTAHEVKDILSDPSADPPYEALIIDLRDNAGGLLEAAVETCDAFISEGVIVSTRGRDGEVRSRHTATPKTIVEPDFPIVVLVNGLSASASEIVAACLQDAGRAVVIGDRTWGKGTVQNVLELEGGRSALKLTTASYWRPSGKNIHRRKDSTDDDPWGVTPADGDRIPLTRDLARAVLRRREIDDLYPGLLEENPDLMQAIEERLDAQLKMNREAEEEAERDVVFSPASDLAPPHIASEFDSDEPSRDAAPDEPAPGESAPGEAAPDEAAPDEPCPADPERDAVDDSATAMATDDVEGVDDPQLRRAIDYLEDKLRAPGTAAAAA